MTEIATPQIPNLEVREQNPHTGKIADFLYKSFAPGQGSPYLQRQFMDYAHVAHPDWRIDDNNMGVIKGHVLKRALGHLKYSAPRPGEEAPARIIHPTLKRPNKEESEIDDRLEDLRTALNNPDARDRDDIVREISIESFRRDAEFLFDEYTQQEKGRKRDNPNLVIDTNDPKYRAILDPFLSYYCYYGLTTNPDGSPHSIGDPTIDQAFSDVRDYFYSGKLIGLDRREDSEFDVVVNIYNSHHPENPARW